MLAGLVSDTHDNVKNANKIASIFSKIGVDVVFHMGDIVAPFTLKIFQAFPLYAVFGNNDGEKLLLKEVAEKGGSIIGEAPLEVQLGGKKFLLVHGWGSVERTKRMVYSFARSGDFDFVLYGHTHQRDVKIIGNSTIINPGEACGCLSSNGSAAILDLDAGEVEFLEI
jgi:putative phosphoesterase